MSTLDLQLQALQAANARLLDRVRQQTKDDVRNAVLAAEPIADAADIVEQTIAEKVSVSDEGIVNVAWVNDDGSEASITELVDHFKRSKPDLFQRKQVPAVPDFVGANRTAAMMAENARRQSTEFRSAQDRDTVANATAKGNPWKEGRSFNRTFQAQVTNLDPALAAQLRAEAGV